MPTKEKIPSGGTCGGCDAHWYGLVQAHCALCHRTFTTPNNFDRHRAGSPKLKLKPGECHDPRRVGLVLNKRGHWSQPGRKEEEHL